MECDFCGGIRVNGMPLERHDGEWTRTSGVSPNAKFGCRSCVKEKLEQ